MICGERQKLMQMAMTVYQLSEVSMQEVQWYKGLHLLSDEVIYL